MTATEDLPVLRISGPADLLQAIPYLLGFHPARSLVMVGLADGRLVVTTRMDLEDVAEEDWVHHTLAAMAAGGAQTVVAAVYDDHPGADGDTLPWRGLAAELDSLAERLRLVVADVLLVGRGRWWSLRCSEPGCCPAEGQALAEVASPVAAAATYAGMVALPGRESLATLLAPVADGERIALGRLLAEAERECARTLTAAQRRSWQLRRRRELLAHARAADGGTLSLDAAAVATLGVALRSTVVRDAMWTAADAGRIDGRELWRELARRLPSPYDAAPLFLFGWSSWRHGEGALANIACDRALASDPAYSAADLLLAALSSALDPRQVPRMRMPRSA